MKFSIGKSLKYTMYFQILFWILFIVLFIWSQGYVMFGSLSLGLYNIIISFFIFVFLGLTKEKKSESRELNFFRGLGLILILLFLLVGFNVKSVFWAYGTRIAILMNSPTILKLTVEEYGEGTEEEDRGLFEIAQNTNNSDICNQITSQDDRSDCLRELDPEYHESNINCNLYSKYGSRLSNHRNQYDCIIDKYVYAQFESNNPIICDEISPFLVGNDFLNQFMFRCEPIQILQEIKFNGTANDCKGFLTEPLSSKYWASHYMACIGNFEGETEWIEACNTYRGGFIHRDGTKTGTPEYLMALGKCLLNEPEYSYSDEAFIDSYKYHENYGNSLEPFIGGTPPKYYQQK